jgi:hypothetical protein
LDINIYKYAISVLLRVFLELSADKFNDKYKLSTVDVKGHPLSLNAKLNNIAQYMSDNGIAVQRELTGIRRMAGKDGEFTTDSFNNYVHNRHFSPTVDSLTTGWDNIQIFMEKLWSNI